MATVLEEKLREAASIGDLYAVTTLISRNVNVNSQNVVNGWTALHWAAKRGHEDVVRVLLQHGADPKLTNKKGERPTSANESIARLLGNVSPVVFAKETECDFVPNYLENPPLCVDLSDVAPEVSVGLNKNIPLFQPVKEANDLVLRAKIANSENCDEDYIEFEIPSGCLTYNYLLKKCCEELGINENRVAKIKKGLVQIRNDSDVRRLDKFEYLDVFLK